MNPIYPILGKYEQYLLPCSYQITPSIWNWWKEHGTYPWKSKEEELTYKHLHSGWDKDAIGKNIDSGILSKGDVNELLQWDILKVADVSKYCNQLPYGADEYKEMLLSSIAKESVTDEEKKSILVALCSIGCVPSPKDYTSLIASKSVTTAWLVELESQLSEHLDLLQVWAGPEEELPLWESIYDWADESDVELKDL